MTSYAANEGNDSVSNSSVPLEQSLQDDDGWIDLGTVTLFYHCNCCSTCDGDLSSEMCNARLYVKEVTTGKLTYKVYFSLHYYAVSVFSHPSGYTIGRGRIDKWDFYLYL